MADRTGPTMQNEPGDPVQWDAPIFVVSAGRSGSTHLANVLDSHPDIAITHESNIAHYVSLTHSLSYQPLYTTREISGFRLNGLIPEVYSQNLADAVLEGLLSAWKNFYRRQFAHKPFTRWADKFQFPEVVPDLIRFFPKARFVYIVRDGRDSARSGLLHNQRERERVGEEMPLMSFADHCDYWLRINRELINALSAAENSHRLRYEDLVLDPEPTTKAVLDFLGLERHPQMDAFLAEQSGARFQSHGTSKDPKASIGRWQTELSDEEKGIAERVQGDLLRELGY